MYSIVWIGKGTMQRTTGELDSILSLASVFERANCRFMVLDRHGKAPSEEQRQTLKTSQYLYWITEEDLRFPDWQETKPEQE